MPFNGNGSYLVPAGTQGVSGLVIDAAVYNALLADLQTALSQTLLRDGQASAANNIPMGGFKFTGLGAGSAAGQSVRFEQLYALPKGTYTPVQSVAYASTLSLDASLSNVFEVAPLSGNVTSMTILNPQAGQTVNIRFVQDATGNRTVAVPAAAKVNGILEGGASRVTWLIMTYSLLAGRWEGSYSSVPA